MSAPREVAEASSVAGRAVPWVLVGVLSGVLAYFAWQRFNAPARAPFAPPEVSDPDEEIAAFGAEVAVGAAARCVYQLTPLWADRERQAFDAHALRERLKLGEGEPWRLECSVEGVLTDAERAALAEQPVEVTVRDDAGRALASLAAEPATRAVVDPVRTLIETSRAEFAPQAQRTWILWGRAPVSGVRLEFGAQRAEIALEPRTVRRSRIEVPMARLELESSGKNDALDASEGDRGAPHVEQR